MKRVSITGGTENFCFLGWDPNYAAEIMSTKNFSANFFSLQLQLNSLLEDAGGEAALTFLDKLSSLHKSEQKIMMRIFENTVDRVRNGDIRLETEEDLVLQNFEKNLYNDIVYAMQTARVLPEPMKLAVVDGGKSPAQKPQSAPINLAERRHSRKLSTTKPLLN